MTRAPHLINVAASQRPRTILDGVIRLYRTVFPERLRAAYLLGSRSDDSAASISDLDGLILFKGDFLAGEREQARRMLAACRLISPIRLDLWVMAELHEAFLELHHDVRLRGGELVYGEDVRDRIPSPSLDAQRRYIVRWPARYISLLHDDKSLNERLEYPDPGDEFFGYAKIRQPSWYPDGVREGTKELVAALFWTTTARLVLEADRPSKDRAEVLRLAHEHLDEASAAFLAEVYLKCKTQWGYRVPQDPADRAALRRICEKTLAFCNHYLERHGGSAGRAEKR